MKAGSLNGKVASETERPQPGASGDQGHGQKLQNHSGSKHSPPPGDRGSPAIRAAKTTTRTGEKQGSPKPGQAP
jgi:hypothetical protein